MNDDQIIALELLIEFAREINYSDSRFAPKDINRASDELEDYLRS